MTTKKLGLVTIILMTINGIIGTGIFLSPGSVTLIAGSSTPLIYVVAATLAIVLALTFASAAKYVTKSGAAYAYAKAAFGDNIGFYVGITRFIAAGIAWGVLATGVVKTVLSIYGLDSTNTQYITIGFVVLMAVLLGINIVGIRFFAIVNNLSTAGKVIALLTVIVVGGIIVVSTGQNHFDDVNHLAAPTGGALVPPLDVSTFVTATLAAFYAFTGFESAATASEDMEKPEKNLPRALIIAIAIIAFIYVGIIIIAMSLNSAALVQTKEVVVLAAVFDNPIIRNIVLYGALISMFGINVGASFGTPRILEALSREGQIPAIFSRRTEQGCPIYATLFTIAVAVVLPIAFDYNMTSIIILSSVSRFIQFLVVPIAVIVFFYGKSRGSVLPNASKNFFTDVIIPIVAFIFSLFLMVKFNWRGQFSTIDAAGVASLNIAAIFAVILGYAVLPAALFIWKNYARHSQAVVSE